MTSFILRSRLSIIRLRPKQDWCCLISECYFLSCSPAKVYTFVDPVSLVVYFRAYETNVPKFQVWTTTHWTHFFKCYLCSVHPNLAQIEHWELKIKISLEPLGLFNTIGVYFYIFMDILGILHDLGWRSKAEVIFIVKLCTKTTKLINDKYCYMFNHLL